MIGYGVCVGSWAEFGAYIVPWVGDQSLYAGGAATRPLVALGGQTSIAVAYNAILDTLAKQELAAVVLIHTDLEITDEFAEPKILDALQQPGVALVGVAGGGAANGTMWWDDHPIGHQRTDRGMIDFGTRQGDVEVLEGSLLAFSPWAVEHLRFDENVCQGMHAYDEIGLQATRGHGKRCVVVDLDTFHHNPGGFKSAESQNDWHTGRQRVMQKWRI